MFFSYADVVRLVVIVVGFVGGLVWLAVADGAERPFLPLAPVKIDTRRTIELLSTPGCVACKVWLESDSWLYRQHGWKVAVNENHRERGPFPRFRVYHNGAVYHSIASIKELNATLEMIYERSRQERVQKALKESVNRWTREDEQRRIRVRYFHDELPMAHQWPAIGPRLSSQWPAAVRPVVSWGTCYG